MRRLVAIVITTSRRFPLTVP